MMIHGALAIPIPDLAQDSALPGYKLFDEKTYDFSPVLALIFGPPEETVALGPGRQKNLNDVRPGSGPLALELHHETILGKIESQPLPWLMDGMSEDLDGRDIAKIANPLPLGFDSSEISYRRPQQSALFVPREFTQHGAHGSGTFVPALSLSQTPRGLEIFADEEAPDDGAWKSAPAAQEKAPTLAVLDKEEPRTDEMDHSPRRQTSACALFKAVQSQDPSTPTPLMPAIRAQRASTVEIEASLRRGDITELAPDLNGERPRLFSVHSQNDKEMGIDPRPARPIPTNKELGAQGNHPLSPAQEPKGPTEDLAREYFPMGRPSGENRDHLERSQHSLVASRDVVFRQEIARAQAEARTVSWASVIERVSGEIVGQLRHNRHEALIRLDPPELGHLKIELVVEGDKIQARISAEALEARGLIQSHLPELRQALQAHKLELVEVRFESADWGAGRDDLAQKHQQGSGGQETGGEVFSGQAGSSSDREEPRRIDSSRPGQGRVSIRA